MLAEESFNNMDISPIENKSSYTPVYRDQTPQNRPKERDKLLRGLIPGAMKPDEEMNEELIKGDDKFLTVPLPNIKSDRPRAIRSRA